MSSISTDRSNAHNTPLNDIESNRSDDCFHESSLSRWKAYGNPIKLQMQKLSVKGAILAGLATDCRSAFFCSEDKACIYQINNEDAPRGLSWCPEPFAPATPQNCRILDAALSKNFFALNTQHEILVFHNGVSCGEREVLIQHRCQYGSPSCLALHEANDKILLAVGSSYVSEDDGRKGHVSVDEYKLSTPRIYRTKIHSFSLAHNDMPKQVGFDPSGHILVCITAIFSSILAWQDISTTTSPHQFISNKYVSDATFEYSR